MARNKRLNLAGMLGVIAITAGLVVPLQLAGTAGAATDYGYAGSTFGQEVMRLHTTGALGDTDRFYLNGSATPVDVIGTGTGNKKCQLRLDGTIPADPRVVPGDLVTLRAFGRVPATGAQSLGPSGWTVGFSNTDNSIGVGSESSSNIKCSQVNEVSPTSEVLVIELNNGVGSELHGWMWDVLELDLEAKFRPQHVFYQLLDDGVAVIGQEKVELPICVDPTADCGPDSNDSDNWRVTIPQPVGGAYPSVLFDEIRIWPESDGGVVGNGSIDLKGGSDGTAPFCLVEDLEGSCTEHGLADDVDPAHPKLVTDSLLHLVRPAEGQICPGQTITEPTGTGEATVEYLTWAGEGDGCKLYALDYDRDAANQRQLTFLTAGASADATFEVSVSAWDPERAVNPVPLSLTDPAGADDDATGEWCNGTPASPIMPPGESWCAVSMSVQTYGPDGDGSVGNPDWVPGYSGQLIQVTEVWRLVGDATIQRR